MEEVKLLNKDGYELMQKVNEYGFKILRETKGKYLPLITIQVDFNWDFLACHLIEIETRKIVEYYESSELESLIEVIDEFIKKLGKN